MFASNPVRKIDVLFVVSAAVPVIVTPLVLFHRGALNLSSTIVIVLVGAVVAGSSYMLARTWFKAFLAETRDRERHRAESRLRTLREQLQLEKLATLGTLAAGVAHEVNSPLAAIKTHTTEFARDFSDLLNRFRAVENLIPDEDNRDEIWSLIALLRENAMEPRAYSRVETRERVEVIEALLKAHGCSLSLFLIKELVYAGVENRDVERLLKACGPGPLESCVKFLMDIYGLFRGFHDISLGATRIEKILKALRYYVHLGRSGSGTERVNILDGLQYVLSLLKPQLKDIRLITRFNAVSEVRCNVDEITQVWTNIIQNAVQAVRELPAGEGRILVETFESLKDETVSVCVQNNGPPVPENIRSKIFEPFFTTKKTGDGTGLGLGLSQEIIHRHHGRIELDTNEERTRFTIILPGERASEHGGVPERAPESSAASSASID